MQAGMLALARAVDGYDGKSKFKGYAYTCIENGVLSALREKNSKKNLFSPFDILMGKYYINKLHQLLLLTNLRR